MPASDTFVHYIREAWVAAGLVWTADNQMEVENAVIDLKSEIRSETSADIGTAIDNHLSVVHKET